LKHLTVIRHAKTKKQKQGQRDFDRSLKKEGVAAAERLGELLAQQTGTPDLFLTSPAKRALQTTDGICKTAHIDAERITEIPVLYENDATSILYMLKDLSDDTSRVFIVGHNPSFGELVQELCNPDFEGMKTGSAVSIEFSIDSWKDIAPDNASLQFYITG
jgi:phosphohistidine phosphatase